MKFIFTNMEEFKKIIYPEYLKLFPKLERKTLKDIENSFSKNITKIVKITENDNFIGFIIYNVLEDKKYLQLDYFAILPQYQNKGYGTQALALLKEQSKEYNGIFIEVEKVGLGNNDVENKLRKKIIEFYEKIGFYKLNYDLDLYTVIYSPYILLTSDVKESEEKILKDIFEIYIAILGEKRVKDNCKVIENKIHTDKCKDIFKLKKWNFGIDNDKLVKLVLAGKKTATTCLYDEKNINQIGEQQILIYDNEKTACITETKKVIITEFRNITEKMAYLEGEGDRTLKYYRQKYEEYFKTIDPKFNENTKVIFEIFIVKENLINTRFELAKKIVEGNKNIFGNVLNISEINAGFNNSIFDIDNKYIIKICENTNNDNLFDVEYNFYIENSNNKNIPKLYKYDKTKEIVPYVYEILEKVQGKTIYYYWYKMNETEREKLIKEIVKIIKNLHSKLYKKYDWAKAIKDEMIENFNKTTNLFNQKERKIITDSLNLYDEILSSNKFCLIHNDLHFDNIIIDNNGEIKIIDFNDSKIAPFDYDLRIFFMCQETPWKWANTEMDPYQKDGDYINIFKYIKKYYDELNQINNLNERMIIYTILNDIRLLPRFKTSELKERIVRNSKEILKG